MKFKNLFRKKINIVTHNGNFHADDIFGVAILNLYYQGQIKVIRSRDPKIISQADIVLDTGGRYDFSQKVFDHHQLGGAGKRENGVPYAASGLIWKNFGRKLVKSDEAHLLIDQELIQHLDAEDTGFSDFYSEKFQAGTWTFDKILKTFNPLSPTKGEDSLTDFLFLMNFVSRFLERIIQGTEEKLLNWQKVEEAYQNSEDKRIIVLTSAMNWKKVLISHPEPLYVVFPNSFNANYLISAVPKKEGSYELRKPLPKKWCGQEKTELQKMTSNSGAQFCHNAGFLMETNNLENALLLAQEAANF